MHGTCRAFCFVICTPKMLEAWHSNVHIGLFHSLFHAITHQLKLGEWSQGLFFVPECTVPFKYPHSKSINIFTGNFNYWYISVLAVEDHHWYRNRRGTCRVQLILFHVYLYPVKILMNISTQCIWHHVGTFRIKYFVMNCARNERIRHDLTLGDVALKSLVHVVTMHELHINFCWGLFLVSSLFTSI